MMKYIGLIIVALSIDAFQALLALAIAGAAFGTSASVVWIPFIGAAAAGALNLAGVVIGMAFDVTISFVFGSGLIIMLMFFGLLSLRQLFTIRRMPFVLAKFIPFIDTLPFYTALVVLCILEKEAQGKTRGASAALGLATAGAGAIKTAAGATNKAAPNVVYVMRQNSLSSYATEESAPYPGYSPYPNPGYNQEDEVAGQQKAGRIRPVLNDIRPQSSRPRAQTA